jgi:Skp family chaperone for outer membrane proteins
LTADDLAAAQADMWAQRVTEAEAVLCRTSDPAAVRAAIAAHERCEKDWQAARIDAKSLAKSLARRQREARREQRQYAEWQQQQRWNAYTRAVEARRAADEQEEADLRQHIVYEARRAETERLAAEATAAAHAARVQHPLTLRNGTWRGWGGLSANDRVAVAESSDWDTDIDEWTQHVVDAHLDAMVPASLLAVTPVGREYGDARE